MVSKKAKGRYDKTSASFGFNEWSLNVQGTLDDLKSELGKHFADLIAEALVIATTEYECHAWFRDSKEDPTTIYVELPLGPSDCEGPGWSFSLRDIVRQMILGSQGGDGEIVPESIQSATAIRDSLRVLADEIDQHLPAS